MSVKLTSPALGQGVDSIYTGPEEDWLLAQGYAKRDADTAPTSYTGPGVQNEGTTDVAPDDDLTRAENREEITAKWDEWDGGRLDPALVELRGGTPDPITPAYDFDAGGVNDEAPDLVSVEPTSGAAAGGETLTLTGTGFEGTTAVTVGGAAATDLVVVDDSTITVTTPATTAGAQDVVVTNPNGSDTLTGGFTTA